MRPAATANFCWHRLERGLQFGMQAILTSAPMFALSNLDLVTAFYFLKKL
jgi:hypothetical protein